MKKIAVFAIMAFVAASLAGCNTLHGAGQDLERAGEAVQDATN